MKRTILFLIIINAAWSSETPFKRGVNLTGWLQTSNVRQIQLTKFTKQDFINIKSPKGGIDQRIPLNDAARELLKAHPKTLTDRLRELEKFNLITRTVFNEIPPRVEYSLTEPGRDLEDIFERISNWVKNWSES